MGMTFEAYYIYEYQYYDDTKSYQNTKGSEYLHLIYDFSFSKMQKIITVAV